MIVCYGEKAGCPRENLLLPAAAYTLLIGFSPAKKNICGWQKEE
jgi:hypothetical protein